VHPCNLCQHHLQPPSLSSKMQTDIKVTYSSNKISCSKHPLLRKAASAGGCLLGLGGHAPQIMLLLMHSTG
jgi:hypothetical protein